MSWARYYWFKRFGIGYTRQWCGVFCVKFAPVGLVTDLKKDNFVQKQSLHHNRSWMICALGVATHEKEKLFCVGGRGCQHELVVSFLSQSPLRKAAFFWSWTLTPGGLLTHASHLPTLKVLGSTRFELSLFSISLQQQKRKNIIL